MLSAIPLAIECIEWFIANEPQLEKDARQILTAAKDVLSEIHGLETDLKEKK